MKYGSKVNRLTSTALMAAVVFVVTYLVRIPLPFASGGYLNIGDAPVYLGAYLLGGPLGAVAAALGSALSDLAAGYVAYALPTAAVKGAMGLVCGLLMARGGFARFVLASALGGAIMVFGYAAFEIVLFNANQALVGIPFNLAQWVCGVGISTFLYPAAQRVQKFLKKNL